jgi:hypothetical protein
MSSEIVDITGWSGRWQESLLAKDRFHGASSIKMSRRPAIAIASWQPRRRHPRQQGRPSPGSRIPSERTMTSAWSSRMAGALTGLTSFLDLKHFPECSRRNDLQVLDPTERKDLGVTGDEYLGMPIYRIPQNDSVLGVHGYRNRTG